MLIEQKLADRIKETNSLLCVGLDSDVSKLPARFRDQAAPQLAFNTWIIDQTHDLVSAYKPNLAFYEARGEAGWHELRLTMQYLQAKYPEIVTIADAKRADIGNTNQGYVTAIFDDLGFDAITLHPYLGREALQPFLDRTDKVSIILCKTSNPGGAELQDLVIATSSDTKQTLWQRVAEIVSQEWNTNHNCWLVAGATYPNELQQVRQLVGEMTILVPGVGAQGGQLSDLTLGLNTKGQGLVINASRSVLFDKSPRTAAEKIVSEWRALTQSAGS